MTILLLIDPLAADEAAPAEELDARLTVADAAVPALSVLDAGVARGDGIFETLGVVDGHAYGVDAHLMRLERSAVMLDLPLPNHAQWRHAIARGEEALRASAAGAGGQAAMRLVMTRGVEGPHTPHAG